MCEPSSLGSWLILDFAYLLALLGGTIVLRSRFATPLTWVLFGLLSAAVGAFLLLGTALAQEAYQSAISSAYVLSSGVC